MTPEYIKIHIENALDLIQIITEDIEDNLVTSDVDGAVKARATMTISALYILGDYLRSVKAELSAEIGGK